MIKIYSMPCCKDCKAVEKRIEGMEGMENYEIIDITASTANMKEFLKLRDNSPFFADIKEAGKIGVPCFVFEDGYMSFGEDSLEYCDYGEEASCGCGNGHC